MIIQTVNLYQFRDAFQSIRPDNFSYQGLEALFDYLEQLSDDTGEPIELDVIAICCDFSEFESLDDIREQYPDIKSIDDLRDETTVIEFDSGIIIADY